MAAQRDAARERAWKLGRQRCGRRRCRQRNTRETVIGARCGVMRDGRRVRRIRFAARRQRRAERDGRHRPGAATIRSRWWSCRCSLRIAVVHPHCQVPTAEARRLVNERTYGLDVIVSNIGSVAALVAALYRGDFPLLGRSIDDRIIEPLRAPLIPGFAAVKNAASRAGALGCSIAGSGPSMFAFADADAAAQCIGMAMQAAFKAAAGLDSDLFWGKVSTEGARVI